MIHRHASGLLTLTIVLIASSTSVPSFAQRRTARAAPANSCVSFSREEGVDGRTVAFELANRCPIAVEGTVSWIVVCGVASGGSPEEHIETLQPNTTRVIVASAAACGPLPFRIDNVHWSWRRSADAE